MKIYIYKFTNQLNNQAYVGQTRSPKSRFLGHRNSPKLKNQTKFSKAITEFGFSNFNYEIIDEIEHAEPDVLQKLANSAELKYIEQFDCFQNGYNIREPHGKVRDLAYLQTLVIQHPNGREETVKNPHEFCEKHKLTYTTLLQTIYNYDKDKHWTKKKTARFHKGYRARRLGEEYKEVKETKIVQLKRLGKMLYRITDKFGTVTETTNLKEYCRNSNKACNYFEILKVMTGNKRYKDKSYKGYKIELIEL